MSAPTSTPSYVLDDPGPPDPPPEPRRRGRRLGRWAALTVAVCLVAGGFGAWWFVLRHEAPAAVSLDEATSAVIVPEADGSAGSASASGTWTVDTSVTTADGTGSFAGFRVTEELVGIGATTAVGRTPAVEGTITVDGTQVTAASFTADLTDITSNDSRRNGAIQRALGTSRYPDATFVLTEPIDVGTEPVEGQSLSVPAVGELTVHGVTKAVTVDLEAQLTDGVLVVVGSTPVSFSDYGISTPSAPIVASVDDHGTIELRLYLTRS